MLGELVLEEEEERICVCVCGGGREWRSRVGGLDGVWSTEGPG